MSVHPFMGGVSIGRWANKKIGGGAYDWSKISRKIVLKALGIGRADKSRKGDKKAWQWKINMPGIRPGSNI